MYKKTYLYTRKLIGIFKKTYRSFAEALRLRQGEKHTTKDIIRYHNFRDDFQTFDFEPFTITNTLEYDNTISYAS